jgi:hypothetical protein
MENTLFWAKEGIENDHGGIGEDQNPLMCGKSCHDPSWRTNFSTTGNGGALIIP